MPQVRHGNHSEAHILLGNISCSCNRCEKCFTSRQMLSDHLETCMRCKTCFKRFQTLEESQDHSCGEKLCLVYTSPTDPLTTFVVADVSKDRISEECFSTITLPFWIDYPGFGSLGMKCYFFGGDNRTGKELDRMGLWLPRDVYVCDLSCKKLSWKNGPKLHGGKPSPIVVTVNGKLYTLAGDSHIWIRLEKLENLFEVFDPMHGTWRVLPEPPFIKLYKKGPGYPRFQGHTVVGSIIYLKIGKIDNPDLYSFNVDTEKWHEHRGEYYDSFSSAGLDELILHNLRYCTWRRQADVVNYLMFQTSGNMLDKLNVFAYDLTSNIKDRYDSISNDVEVFEEDQVGSDRDLSDREDQVGPKSNPSKIVNVEKKNKKKVGSEDVSKEHDSNNSEIIKEKKKKNKKKAEIGSESNAPKNIVGSKIGKDKEARPNKYDMLVIDEKGYELVKNDRVITVPVFGLTSIDRDIPCRAKDLSFVTHLRENLYSLVSFYTSLTDDYRKMEHVNVCAFEASFIELSDKKIEMKEQVVAANNVRELKWVGSYLGLFVDWCKVPNDGRQSQFRPPQMQYGKELTPYHDNFAGRVVHENQTSQYLQVVDWDYDS